MHKRGAQNVLKSGVVFVRRPVTSCSAARLRRLSKDVSHRRLSECSPLYLLGYVKCLYALATFTIHSLGRRRVMEGGGKIEREGKEVLKENTKDREMERGERERKKKNNRRRGAAQVTHGRRRRMGGGRENVGRGQSIIQKRKVHRTLGACLEHAWLASPANGPRIDMLPEQALLTLPSSSLSLSLSLSLSPSPAIRALISAPW